MATTDATPRVARRRRRSLVFYAWTGFIGQVLLGLALVAFVVAGSAYQRAAIQTNARVQRLQLINLSMQASFLDAERSLRGYQLTGQNRFLQSYYNDRVTFAERLRAGRAQAWQGILPALTREAGFAAAAFRAGDRGLAAPQGSGPARRLLALAGELSDSYVTASNRMQGQLGTLSGQLSSQSQQSLGIGLLGTTIVLLGGMLVPVAIAARLVARTVVPLHSTTEVVRRLAAGEQDARAAAAGPAEIRDLAGSINFLADESARLRAEQQERVQLAGMVRETAAGIREHLDAEGVIRKAVEGIRTNLGSDFVWVTQMTGGQITLPAGNPADLGLLETVTLGIPESFPDYLDILQDLYRERGSYLQDLHSAEAAVLPGPFLRGLLDIGGAWLLSIPYGAGRELMGTITLLRTDPRRPWTGPERTAAESIASDLGRGLEHARLYQQQKELVARLREVDQAKSDFLAAVSHDLRTPLTSIVGYAEMLEEDKLNPLSPAQRQMLSAIDRNADRLGNLIEDVLTMSRIEMGEFRTVLRPVDLAAVTRETAAEMRDTAAAKGLGFSIEGPAEGLMVSGSAQQLDRALINLLGNAVKYTPHGGSITVTTSRQDGQAVVSVADTGIGIPEQDQQSLFTRFFRGSNVSTTSIPGTGLGLAIVKTIVTNHQGEIVLQSKEGEGTTISVRLPLLPAGQPDAEPGSGPAGAEPGGTEPGGTEPGGTEPGGTEPGGTEPGGTEPGGGQGAGA
jgi:two-component system phosphate regulon sensor histidine kinase PhoR